MPTTAPALRRFLSRPSRPRDEPTYEDLRGFVFAVTCAPELVPPSEWLPAAFGGDLPRFDTEEDAQRILSEVTKLYKAALSESLKPGMGPPRFRGDVLDNFAENAAASQWSRGLLRGHGWLEESWGPYVFDELEEELNACLLVLGFFASKQAAKGVVREAARGKTLAALATTCREIFGDAMRSYAVLGRSIYQALLEHGPDPTPAGRARTRVSVGRNAPCPCGSGRKHKRCCGEGR